MIGPCDELFLEIQYISALRLRKAVHTCYKIAHDTLLGNDDEAVFSLY